MGSLMEPLIPCFVRRKAAVKKRDWFMGRLKVTINVIHTPSKPLNLLRAGWAFRFAHYLNVEDTVVSTGMDLCLVFAPMD